MEDTSRWLRTLLITLLGLAAISFYARDAVCTTPSLIFTRVAPSDDDKQWPIYEDEGFRMVAVNYGDGTKQSTPGFFVFRKSTADWIRIDKVSTRGAIFGRNPTLEEVKSAGAIPPSIGWDFLDLAEDDYVDFPLTSAGFLFFPDEVELDDKKDEYVLHFNSGWDIEGVETVLRFSVDELSADLHRIIERYRYLLLAEEPPSTDAISEYIRRLSPDGSWPDISYADSSETGWELSDHLKRIRSMALAFDTDGHKLEGDPSLHSDIEAALDHWLTSGYRTSNRWWNQIGGPRIVRDIVVLMNGELEGELRNTAVDSIKQYELSGTGANLMWSAELFLHHGCLAVNEEQVAEAVRRIWAEIRVGEGAGIQSDWSFHQHEERLQAFHYGRAYLDVVSKVSWQLQDTPWSIPEDKRTVISDYILEGVRWMCRGIHTVPGTLDRAVSRKGSLGSADLGSILGLWREIHPERAEELDAFFADQELGRTSLAGYRHFPVSDLTVYHRPEGSIFLKTISSRTLPTENLNGENKKGVPYLNCGDHYVLRDGREYSGLQPVWAWQELPGLTTAKELSSQKRRNFVGGIGNGMSGLTAMDYERVGDDHAIRVCKAWAFHENMMVCLLSGWDNTETAGDIFTSIEQCRLRGPILMSVGDSTILELEEGLYRRDDVRWILHNGIGYIPIGWPVIRVHLADATGSWDAINARYEYEEVSEPVLRIGLEHGTDLWPVGYAIVLGADEDLLDAVSGYPDWEILRSDRQCQGIRFGGGAGCKTDRKISMAAFYGPGSIPVNGGLRVTKPCLAMWTHDRLWLSDPTNQGTELVVIWDDKKYNAVLPMGGGVKEIIPSGETDSSTE
jgi:chondroitin AC lyase